MCLDTREYYVIKEIDTAAMTTEQAFEALEEISVQATIDSPYVVSLNKVYGLIYLAYLKPVTIFILYRFHITILLSKAIISILLWSTEDMEIFVAI